MILLLGTGQDQTLVGTKVNVSNAVATVNTLNLSVSNTLTLGQGVTH